MAQGPITVSAAVRPNAAQTSRSGAPMLLDPAQTLLTGKGLKVAFNKTAATIIQAGVGRVAKVSVIVAGSAVGSVNDVATTGAAAVGNQLAVIPNTVGVYDVDMPVATALVVVPGTGQTVAVSYQ